VEDLREGMIVWTAGATGERIAAPVLLTGRTRAPPGHEVVQVRLADGRTVAASPGHPTAGGVPLGALRPGEPLDGTAVTAVGAVLYGGTVTYDLLPAGPSGGYWADGILLGSTLG
jgi:hypothetical protein